jgi:hypothetical protein
MVGGAGRFSGTLARLVKARIAAGDIRGVVIFVGGGVARLVIAGGAWMGVAGVCSGALVRVMRGGSATLGLGAGGVCACRLNTRVSSIRVAVIVFT